MHRENATNLFPLCPDRDHLLSPQWNTNRTAVLVSKDVPFIRVCDGAKFPFGDSAPPPKHSPEFVPL